MRKGTTREVRDRQRYLATDFGEALARLEPMKLDLEFPSPTQSISIRLPRRLLDKIRILADERDVRTDSRLAARAGGPARVEGVVLRLRHGRSEGI